MKLDDQIRLALRSMAGEVMAVDTERMQQRIAQAIAMSSVQPLKQYDSVASLLQAMDKVDTRSYGSTSIISVSGTLEYKLSLMGYWFGGSSYRAISKAIDTAVGDPQVERIVLEIDSPGGTVTGLKELCDKIYATREVKDIIAVANPIAASAALRIGCAARQFFGIGSAWVGSLGSVSFMESWVKYFEELGIDARCISDPEPKGEGNVERPITDEALAYRQQLVVNATKEFVKDVAKYRGVSTKEVNENFGQGRMIWGVDAAKVGLLDGVKSLDQILLSRPMKIGNGSPRAESHDENNW